MSVGAPSISSNQSWYHQLFDDKLCVMVLGVDFIMKSGRFQGKSKYQSVKFLKHL